MTSDELSEAVAEAIEATVERVMGTGKDQYDDGSGVQKFETLDIDDLVKWTLEELDDLMVYNVMLRIRLTRIRDAVRKATVDAENKKAQADAAMYTWRQPTGFYKVDPTSPWTYTVNPAQFKGGYSYHPQTLSSCTCPWCKKAAPKN